MLIGAVVAGGVCLQAKHNAGFVPNWAGGGCKSQASEPVVGSRVLLDLYRRFGDVWLVELLFDDLLDWHNWNWWRADVCTGVNKFSCNLIRQDIQIALKRLPL